MENFADQCIDMAQSILSHNLESITEQGTIVSATGETSLSDEPGHAALAIGEYYRATMKTSLDDFDLIDLAARVITAQTFSEENTENGLAHAVLGLLSFGSAKDRNPVWERLVEPTRERLDQRLLEQNDYRNHYQAFNIAKSVSRFSLGLSSKDETGALIDRFLERIDSRSSTGYFDDSGEDASGIGGTFDIYGVSSFVLIRQALQLHVNLNLREHKLPNLRSYAEKYLKLIVDLTRQDGLGWAYGRAIGAYGQMHCISLILQALRDSWGATHQLDLYTDAVRSLFMNFFATYLDQEHGYLVIRDKERNTIPEHTTRMANFDAAHYLCQWSRLARSVGSGGASSQPIPPRKIARYVGFDKSYRKEQGLFVYQDPESGLGLQLPLMSPGERGKGSSDYLAFPHSPGIFDWPADRYLPIMQPELTFGDKVIVPSFYGKNCTTGIGLRNTLNFKYDQPELITKDGKFVNGLGSCKVTWSFLKNKIVSDFSFSVKQQVTLNKMRYILGIALPHSRYRSITAFALGEAGHRTEILKDDFQAQWGELETVSQNPHYRTYYGNMHYLQILQRDHPLLMRPGLKYQFSISFEPDITFADESVESAEN